MADSAGRMHIRPRPVPPRTQAPRGASEISTSTLQTHRIQITLQENHSGKLVNGGLARAVRNTCPADRSLRLATRPALIAELDRQPGLTLQLPRKLPRIFALTARISAHMHRIAHQKPSHPTLHSKLA